MAEQSDLVESVKPLVEAILTLFCGPNRESIPPEVARTLVRVPASLAQAKDDIRRKRG